MSFSTQEVSGHAELMELLPGLDPHDQTLIINAERGDFDRFAVQVREARGLVTDFDGTVNNGNQWLAMRECMRSDLAEEDAARAQWYMKTDSRTDREDIDFIFGSVHRLVESGLKSRTLVQYAHATDPRPCAVDLMKSFHGKAVVVSFGLADFIRAWLDRFGIGADIAALDLRWVGEHLIGFHARTVVTDGNKGFMYDAFLAEHELRPDQVLAIGDAPTDIRMMRPEGLGVLVIPKVDPQPGRMESRMRGLADIWPCVSAVLVSNSLEPLAALRSG